MHPTKIKSEAHKPEENEIRAQLIQILKDPEFERSPKIIAFLEYVVNETLEGRKKYLKAFSVATEVFKQDSSFDPQTNPLVRVNAVRLRRMLRQYYNTQGNKDEVIIDLVKGSYAPKISYRKENQKNNDIDKNIIQECSFPSIAILYFSNMTNDSNYENFIFGISQEIQLKLSKIKEIVVIARTAINKSSDDFSNTKNLSEKIDVRYVLTGSVYIHNNSIRLIVELDDTSTQKNVWTQDYEKDFNMKGVLAIQDEIAIQVASIIAQPYGVIIREELKKIKKIPTEDLTAYQLFLLFYQWSHTFSQKEHHIARKSLERAVEIDPFFSDAWAALALLYNVEYQLSYNELLRDRDVRDLALDAARTAIKVDPENARAHYSLAFTNMVRLGTRSCLAEAESVYKLDPNNPLQIAIYATRLVLCGELNRGLELLEQAIVLNPSHPDFYYIPIVINYYFREQYELALQELMKISMPEFYWYYLISAALYADMEDMQQANHAADKLIELYPDFQQKARFELEKWDMPLNLTEKNLKWTS